MKVKLTHKEADTLLGGILQVNQSGTKLPAKFNYGLQKNAALLKVESETVANVHKDKLGAYVEAVNAIQKEYRALPQKEQTERRAEYDKKIAYLQTFNEASIKEWDAFLGEQVEIELHAIKMADLPDGITGGQLNALMPLVEE